MVAAGMEAEHSIDVIQLDAIILSIYQAAIMEAVVLEVVAKAVLLLVATEARI